MIKNKNIIDFLKSSKIIKALSLMICFIQITQASPATQVTIEKYMQVNQLKDLFEKQYQLKNAYYDDLALKRVIFSLKTPNLDPSKLTIKQKLAVQKIAQIYKKNDPFFRTPDEQYQYQMKQYAKYHSEESLQYFIEHSKTEAEQELIKRFNVTSLYFTAILPDLIPRYLAQTDFNNNVFENTVKITPNLVKQKD